jgi:hypothetical protein
LAVNVFREQLVKVIENILKKLNENDIVALWAFSIKNWVATLKYGHV